MNIALVSNTIDETVSVIDLNTMSVVDTIPTGAYPACYAIDETTMTALLTNMNSNDMTIIDLTKLSTATEDYGMNAVSSSQAASISIPSSLALSQPAVKWSSSSNRMPTLKRF